MPEYNFFQYVLSPAFLITTAFLLIPFGLLGLSVLLTWLENGDKVAALEAEERQRMAELRAARRARAIARKQRQQSAS
ncbi:MAG: hypothetical protein AAFV98_13275 [Chloroflexota bacterium]